MVSQYWLGGRSHLREASGETDYGGVGYLVGITAPTMLGLLIPIASA